MKKPSLLTKITFALLVLLNLNIFAQNTRTLSGTVLTQQFELVPDVTIEVETSDEKLTTVSDAEGNFSIRVPNEPLSVKFSGNNIAPQTRIFAADDKLENVQIKINYVVPPASETVTITDD